MVQQWVSTLTTERALHEIEYIRLKYPWLRCEVVYDFIKRMSSDLPKVGNLVIAQEKQLDAMKRANYNLKEYIRLNRLADEVILDDIKSKFKIDL